MIDRSEEQYDELVEHLAVSVSAVCADYGINLVAGMSFLIVHTVQKGGGQRWNK